VGPAKLYWPLIDNIAAADQRRAQIGLPSIEDDLEKFRQGATIGPYMTPMTNGMGHGGYKTAVKGANGFSASWRGRGRRAGMTGSSGIRRCVRPIGKRVLTKPATFVTL
jgi:hypothetical protein